MSLGEKFITLNKQLKIGEKTHQLIAFPQKHLSKTELVGTIVHAGFEILKEEISSEQLKLTLKKVATAGSLAEILRARQWLFKQPRVGRDNQVIQVFKLRTMYPMAHKAHEYFMKTAKIGPYGKPSIDYRVTPLGKLLRSFFIDELPQIVNILKGEMKLVGLRPLDKAFFKTLPSALQQQRLQHLPALMAAIYADRPQNLKDRFVSEMKYLSQHAKHPFLTDVKYFFQILWSIIFQGQRGV